MIFSDGLLAQNDEANSVTVVESPRISVDDIEKVGNTVYTMDTKNLPAMWCNPKAFIFVIFVSLSKACTFYGSLVRNLSKRNWNTRGYGEFEITCFLFQRKRLNIRFLL